VAAFGVIRFAARQEQSRGRGQDREESGDADFDLAGGREQKVPAADRRG
jgi:hypothetical protein